MAGDKKKDLKPKQAKPKSKNAKTAKRLKDFENAASALEPGMTDVWRPLFDSSQSAEANAPVRMKAVSPLAAGPASSTLGAPAGDDDQKTEYYQAQPPDWSRRMAPDADAFATRKDYQRYQEELERLRPLARWMAHFYTKIHDDAVERPPNVLSVKRLLSWTTYVKKWQKAKGWNLKDAVLEGAKAMFLRPLPAKAYDARNLQSELTAALDALKAPLDRLDAPERLALIKQKAAPAEPETGKSGMVQFLDEKPSLVQTKDIGSTGAPDYILTKTVKERLEDLMRLYSTDHSETFFPLPIGDTGEGKSSLIKYMFSQEALKKSLQEIAWSRLERQIAERFGLSLKPGRTRAWADKTRECLRKSPAMPLEAALAKALRQTQALHPGMAKKISAFLAGNPYVESRLLHGEGWTVPVISIPVKEVMSRSELLGGKSGKGIDLGFLVMAATTGGVIVLEEINQASGEFRKALNEVLYDIAEKGYFEFEAGGKTVRVQAHPFFWVAATENPPDGNFSMSRNEDSPDFLQRWVVRYYDNFPPVEQAEIMRGLAKRWYGREFVKRHGLTQDFFEKIVTQFHEPVRAKAIPGDLGGDLPEPYEFNRRTLHRFLKRYLDDLRYYETHDRPLDDKTRHLLMARELMEAYGAELRVAGEKDALWKFMDATFALDANWGIAQEDVRIEVSGFYRQDGRLIVEERLVPLEFQTRPNGGERVPGPAKRLTIVPSLAANIYRNLRNRQFHEHQFSTGPTATAKTGEIHFINHMLGEPLFVMNMDENTPMSELHGGWLKDPATGEFEFSPGLAARAVMHDPEGLLKGETPMSAADIRKNPRIGATILFNEGNASPILESINPLLDDWILNLSDGRHSAVAGGATHVVITTNPLGDGYAIGDPLTGALTSRGQTIFHPGDMPEEELTEIILDKLTGVTRYQIRGP